MMHRVVWLLLGLTLNVLRVYAQGAQEQITVTCTFSDETAATFTPKKQQKFMTMFNYYIKTYVHTFSSRSQFADEKTPSYSASIVGVWLASGDHRMLICAGDVEEYPCTLVQPLGRCYGFKSLKFHVNMSRPYHPRWCPNAISNSDVP